MTLPHDVQVARATCFHDLHAQREPLRIANAWSATSARVMVAAGARAIGTTSFGVALDHGVWDGEQLPFEEVLAVACAIAESVDVPVTVDIEAGRGNTASDVATSVAAVVECGAVGVNIEDSIPGLPGAVRAEDEQAARLAAARDAADATGVRLFVNARSDIWFGSDVAESERVDAALSRARCYEAAGADGLFLPGLLDPAVLTVLTAETRLPVNVMVGAAAPPVDQLVAAGVRRLSQGGEPFLVLAGALKLHTERYLAGDPAGPTDALGAGMSVLPHLVATPAI